MPPSLPQVFRRLGFVVRHAECEAVATCAPGAVERVLQLLRTRLAEFEAENPALLPPSRCWVHEEIQLEEVMGFTLCPLCEPLFVSLCAKRVCDSATAALRALGAKASVLPVDMVTANGVRGGAHIKHRSAEGS